MIWEGSVSGWGRSRGVVVVVVSVVSWESRPATLCGRGMPFSLHAAAMRLCLTHTIVAPTSVPLTETEREGEKKGGVKVQVSNGSHQDPLPPRQRNPPPHPPSFLSSLSNLSRHKKE